MFDFKTTLIIVLAVAICTFFTRLFPFVVFSGKKETPDFIKYLGKSLPPAVIAILVIYCFKSTNLFVHPYGIPEFLAIVAVIMVHLWKRNNLLSIGTGTIFYMILIQKVF